MKFLPWLITAMIIAMPATPAAAQEVFNGRAQPSQAEGNPNCPPPVINGITPKNWSCKTGTQYTQGNPNCPPPTIMINGQPTTPRNWSCPGGMPTARNAPVVPFEVHRPGPPSVPGAANPCQPGGPGGYNWLNNPVGTRLPAGCVRPDDRTFTITKRDSRYEPAPMGGHIAPPGSYIQPEGKPGDYIVPSQGAPGSYLQPDGRPGSYLGSTAKNDPKASNNQTRTNTRGTVARSASTNQKPNSGLGRQDTQAMRGDLFNADASSYRQDTGAMQSGLTSGQMQKPANTAAAKNTSAQKNAAAQAAAEAQAIRAMSRFMNAAGGGPK